MANQKEHDKDNAGTAAQRGGSGNFANDREKASEAGRKGGEHSHSGSQHESAASHQSNKSQQGSSESSGSQQGGSGNFSDDPERAKEAGRKGGQHSHGGSSSERD